jgi:hypothetical protein
MSAFMRVAAPIASEVEMALLWIRFDTPWPFCGCIVIKSQKCLSNFCCSLYDVQLSFRSEGRNSEKKVLSVGLKWISFCELASHLW